MHALIEKMHVQFQIVLLPFFKVPVGDWQLGKKNARPITP